MIAVEAGQDGADGRGCVGGGRRMIKEQVRTSRGREYV